MGPNRIVVRFLYVGLGVEFLKGERGNTINVIGLVMLTPILDGHLLQPSHHNVKFIKQDS